MAEQQKAQLEKLAALIKVPPPAGASDELLTLIFKDGKESLAKAPLTRRSVRAKGAGAERRLVVSKVLACLASTMLHDACAAEPGVKAIEVEGTHDMWLKLLGMAHPDGGRAGFWLTGPEVEALLPVAHKAHMQGALNILAAHAAQFKYSSSEVDPMYVLQWLELAERYQMPELAAGCVQHIASAMATQVRVAADRSSGLYSTGHTAQLALKFSPDSIHQVQGPRDVVAFLGAMFLGMRSAMGL